MTPIPAAVITVISFLVGALVSFFLRWGSRFTEYRMRCRECGEEQHLAGDPKIIAWNAVIFDRTHARCRSEYR